MYVIEAQKLLSQIKRHTNVGLVRNQIYRIGCISYVHVPNELWKKLHPKSVKCIFAGYPDDTKGFKLYNLETSRSVLFCEEEFDKFDVKIEANTYINLFPSDEIEDVVNDENGN